MMFAASQSRHIWQPLMSHQPKVVPGFTKVELQQLVLEEERRKYDKEFETAVRAYGWSPGSTGNAMTQQKRSIGREPTWSSQPQDALRSIVSDIDEMSLKSSWERAFGNVELAAMTYFQTRANAIRLSLQQQGVNVSPTG